MKKIPIYLLIILFIFLITRNGCDNSIAGILGVRNVTIDTWDGWKEQLRGIDHFEKYGAISVGFNEDSIRFDFVEKFDEIFSSGAFRLTFHIWSKNDSASV